MCPIYDLQCQACGEVSTYFTHIPTPPTECDCGGDLKVLFGKPQLRWSTGTKTITFEARRTFTQPHKSNDARKRNYFFGG